jgi:hypothetical protein
MNCPEWQKWLEKNKTECEMECDSQANITMPMMDPDSDNDYDDYVFWLWGCILLKSVLLL